LTGFELEPATRAIRRLIISPENPPGGSPITRPLSAVAHVHDGGEIELRPFGETTPLADGAGAAVLGASTRLRAQSRDSGWLIGLDVDPGERAVVTVFARHHWWSRRTDWPAEGLDFSTPGEIRTGPSNRAA
jgi:hypothetical protein